MKRPRGFVILSLFLVYLAVAGVAGDMQFVALYGSVPGLLGILHGAAALAAAIGLWMIRSWALQAITVWSITVLLQIFYMQYGLNGDYTLPLSLFLPYAIITSVFLAGLLYYVRKGILKCSADRFEMATEQQIPPTASKQRNFSTKALFFSCLIFLVASFINFAITIYFISHDLFQVMIFATILNLMPIYFLARYFIAPLRNKILYRAFWIGSIVLSVVLVIPYGAFVLDFVISTFKLPVP